MSLANKFGIPESLLDAAKKALDEANEYQKKVQAHMAKKGIKSLNDLTGDQKKKFFNDLDAMHKAKNEEVEPVEEGSGPKEKQKTPYRDINSPASRAAADKRREEMDKEEKSEKGKKLLGKIAAKNEEVEPVEEELKGEMHKDAHKVLKHIKPEHHGTYKPYLKKGTYKGDYKDRAAVLSAAEKAGHVKEEAELTQEDLDFIASLNQAEVVEGQLRNFSPHSDLAGRGRLSGYNKTAAGKKREYDRETERLKDKMKFTKGQGGIAGPKGKLPEEFELDDFTVEEIEEYMQTEEFAQLDELSKETLGSYVKKRSHDVAVQGALTRKYAMDAEAKQKEHGGYTTAAVRDLHDKSNRAFAKGWKHRQGIGRAVDKIVNKA